MNNLISGKIIGIKHMTFAVKKIELALKTFQNFLGITNFFPKYSNFNKCIGI